MMPSLSTRSFAEMIDKPAFDQIKILHEQKYPKSSPQMFKIPYYSKALTAIRTFYRNKNSLQALSQAVNDIQLNVRQVSKRKNLLRVIDSFRKNPIAKKKFNVKPRKTLTYSKGGVDIRLTFDLNVVESNQTKFIYFNFRNVPIVQELAKKTIEISHYILEQNGLAISIKDIEFIDLPSGKIFHVKSRRKRTIDQFNSNISIVNTLWNTI